MKSRTTDDTGAIPYVFHRVYVWACDTWLDIAEDAATGAFYFPVRPTCRALEIDSPSQNEAIKRDSRLAPGLQSIPIPTRGGAQRTQCLRQLEYAWWLAMIDPSSCKPSARAKLEPRQRALMHLANHVMLKQDDEQVRWQEASLSGELHFRCLRCGAPHCLVLDETGQHLYVGEEVH